MTQKEIKKIQQNIDDVEKIDFYTALVTDYIFDFENFIRSDCFKKVLENAEQVEIDTFLKSLSILHGSLSELHKMSVGYSKHTETDKAILKRFSIVFDYVKMQRIEEQEEQNNDT